MCSQSEEQQADCLSKNATCDIFLYVFCEFRLAMRFCFAKYAALILRVLALRAKNAMS